MPSTSRLKALLAVLLMLLTGGCSPVDALNAFSPTGGVSIRRDLPYAEGERHRADIYAPSHAAGAPIVVFFYGGSWQEGRKEDYAFVALALARRGIVVVVPDYRVYPTVRFDGYMADAAKAVAWARGHAGDWGADPGRLVIMGHSAGAQIAALLTLDARWLATVGLDPHRDVAGMVGLAGPYDFLPLHDPILKIVFGPPARLADTQPISFVDGRNPPMLLGVASNDHVVEPRNTASLAASVAAHGGPVTTRIYHWLDHRTLIGVVSVPLGVFAPVRDDVIRFIARLPRAASGTAR